MTAQQIEKAITEWVTENFGESEADDPSWNIMLLADHLQKKLFPFDPTLSDEAFNTLNRLRNVTFLEDDLDIENACREVANHLEGQR